MKKAIITLLFLLPLAAHAQSLTVFDIDTSSFPVMKAKFWAFDENRKQITNLSPSDFEITENGVQRDVISVSCPEPKEPVAISSVLTIDVSGSMRRSDFGEIPVDLGKTTARELCNQIAMPPSEFALQTCDDKALLIKDFTTNRSKILSSIDPIRAFGGNNFVEQLLSPKTGLLNIAKTGKNKRTAVIYTDAWWYALTNHQLQRCIDTCNKYGIQFFAVIYKRPEAEPNGIKKSLQLLADATGGLLYDGVTSEEAAIDIANKIQQSAQSSYPCEIEWESGIYCNFAKVNLNVSIPRLSLQYFCNYLQSSNSVAKLTFFPSGILFLRKPVGVKADTILTVTAHNKGFNVSYISSNNPEFEVNPNSFSIEPGESKELTVSFTPLDKNYKFAVINFVNDLCNIKYLSTAIYGSQSGQEYTLKLTHPKGGEEFLVGSDTVITWEGVLPSDTVMLDYSIDDGSSWNMISNASIGLEHKWADIPEPPSTKCKVRVRNRYNNEGSGIDIIDLTTHTGIVNHISWSPDGSRVATASDDSTGRIWNAYSGELIHTLSGHTNRIYHISWSPDGSRVATASMDSTGRIWDANSGELIHILS